MASISGPEAVIEGGEALYEVTLTGGMGSTPVVIDFNVGGAVTKADYTVTDEPAVAIEFEAPSES